jgi:uncharacterized protein YggU (UPF0235/DUF167 family)
MFDREVDESLEENAEVTRVLADALGLAPRDVRVVAGQASRDKVVEVDGISLEDAERRLASREDRA